MGRKGETMTNTFNLADYAPKGRAEFDEAKHDSKIEVEAEPKPAAPKPQTEAEKRKAAIAEYDEITLRADRDFGLIPDDFKSEPEHVEVDDGLTMPLDVSGVDLLSPPGFTCQVVDWIDSQCRYPRRRLAVAAGLCAIANIGGMSHEDELDGVTANMLAFCVAASSTGKEAVMQAFSDLHICAGVQGGLQGGIKSEQEVTRNLIEHQAAFYNVDEIGIFLNKVRNAQQKGGASYLEGVFAIIMSAYSKANSRFLLGGDTKRDLRKIYVGQLSKAKDKGDEEAEEKAERMLSMIDNGLERPFLSLIGFTTPSTFDGIMDGETATQGFVGRAIIVNERDINPRARKGFKKQEMPIFMQGRLGLLYGDEGQRVEHVGKRCVVPTDDDAAAALLSINDWLLDYAEFMGEKTGEASVAMIRRGYELVAKISFILAMTDGRRTLEHVRWALAYVKDEMDFKVALVFANDNKKDKPQEALAARLMGYIDADNGVTTSMLANRTRLDKPSIEAMMKDLEGRGLVKKVEKPKKHRGKIVHIWKTA
jgi:hypothetical protein